MTSNPQPKPYRIFGHPLFSLISSKSRYASYKKTGLSARLPLMIPTSQKARNTPLFSPYLSFLDSKHTVSTCTAVGTCPRSKPSPPDSPLRSALPDPGQAGGFAADVYQPVYTVVDDLAQRFGMDAVAGRVKDNEIRLSSIVSSTLRTSPARIHSWKGRFWPRFSRAASTASSMISTPMTCFATGANI